MACETSDDCSNPDWRCLTLRDVETPDELARRCGPVAELGGTCVENSGCLTEVCLSRIWGGVCSEPCGADTSCTLEGWTCQDDVLVAGAEDRPVRLCAAGGNSEVITLDLPATTGPHTFTVPEGVVSIQIVVVADDPNQDILLSELRNPMGEVVTDGGSGPNYPAPLRYLSLGGEVSVIIPNNDDPALQAMVGEWQFGVAPSTIDVRSVQVFMRRSEGAIRRTRWDINILIAPGIRNDLTAVTATEEGYLPAVLDRLVLYWNAVGLQIGEVRYYDLPAEYLVIDSRNELGEMLRLESVQVPSGALNVFFVREVASASGSTFGVSGGIPGAVGVNGTAGSGVVMRVRNRTTTAGDTLAHELGHFLGLWHVTDFVDGPNSDVFFHDVIADTPECGAAPDVVLSDDVCRSNMMFPYTTSANPGFSETQSRIMRESPRGR